MLRRACASEAKPARASQPNSTRRDLPWKGSRRTASTAPGAWPINMIRLSGRPLNTGFATGMKPASTQRMQAWISRCRRVRAAADVTATPSGTDATPADRGGEGPGRGKAGRQVRGDHLIDLQRLRQTMKLMEAQGREADARWPGSAKGVTDRARQEDLAAMAGKADPMRGVDRQTDVSRVGQGRFARMEADADPKLQTIGPGAPLDVALNRE